MQISKFTIPLRWEVPELKMRESRKRIPSNHSQTAATALGKAVMSEQDGKGSGNKGGHREEG